jgi:hypothetical protein
MKEALQRIRRNLLVEVVGAAALPLRRRRPGDPYHAVFDDFIALANQRPGTRVLELGARGAQIDPRLHDVREYVGFDIHPGANVDVTGDAHMLSQLVTGPFDAVYAISTFEHLAMPWKVVLEINAILADGGILFIATHQTWPPHELPWDYWRYSPAAFQALLNAHTGFEIIRAECGLPALIVPMVRDVGMRDVHRNPACLGGERARAQAFGTASRPALGSHGRRCDGQRVPARAPREMIAA